jgi:hypothetical protein
VRELRGRHLLRGRKHGKSGVLERHLGPRRELGHALHRVDVVWSRAIRFDERHGNDRPSVHIVCERHVFDDGESGVVHELVDVRRRDLRERLRLNEQR